MIVFIQVSFLRFFLVHSRTLFWSYTYLYRHSLWMKVDFFLWKQKRNIEKVFQLWFFWYLKILSKFKKTNLFMTLYIFAVSFRWALSNDLISIFHRFHYPNHYLCSLLLKIYLFIRSTEDYESNKSPIYTLYFCEERRSSK